MSKKLIDFVDLLENEDLVIKAQISGGDTTIDCLTYDTHEVSGNTLFVCKGAHFKEEYVHDAIAHGAVAYVSETEYLGAPNCILVSNVRLAMVYLAQMFYDNAPAKITSVGITGTKGKSTTAYYLRAVIDGYMESINKPKCAIVSSIDTYDGVINEESHLTTPEAMPLHKHFYNAVNSGISHLVMEVSSQALKYDRVKGITFDVACFTNIGLDHISPIEHKDFEDYFSSKLKIFDNCKYACINMDAQFSDRAYDYAKGKCKIVTFGSSPEYTVSCSKIEKREDGTYFHVKTPEYESDVCITMPGMFNVSNALATIAMSYVLGIPKEYVIAGLKYARAGGRMQVYTSKDKNVVVIVDYAHNRMSFDALYKSVEIEYPGYKVVSVFGCPGCKAQLRRKDLGELAGLNADYVVLTEEDSGEEPFDSIAKDIEANLGDCPHYVVEDRGQAIKNAILDYEADKKIILLTGKGEETRQKRGTLYIDCPSDVEYTLKFLEEYDKGSSNK